jgi:hypothetical protein
MNKIIMAGAFALATLAGPAAGEVPNPENADHLTGCVHKGRLQSVEISGWGAYRACKGKEEWISFERANLHSRVFTVEAMGRSGALTSDWDAEPPTPVVTVGAFTVYVSPGNCAVAGGSSSGAPIIYAAHPTLQIISPFWLRLGMGVETPHYGAIRQGAPDEVFYNPADGVLTAEVLKVRTIFAEHAHHANYCAAAVNFEYEPTPSAHTIYRHDSTTNGVTIHYRQETSH